MIAEAVQGPGVVQGLMVTGGSYQQGELGDSDSVVMVTNGRALWRNRPFGGCPLGLHLSIPLGCPSHVSG